MKKLKINKLIFITFLPYVLIIFQGIASLFMGVDFFFIVEDPGPRAVLMGMLVTLQFMLIFCILPVCLAIQFFYILYRVLMWKEKTNAAVYICYIGAPIVIILGVILYFVIMHFSNYSRPLNYSDVKKMYKNAEVIYQYDLANEYTTGSYEDENLKYPTIMIDKDKQRLGYVYDDGYNSYYSEIDMHLESDSAVSTYLERYPYNQEFQKKVVLDDGSELTCYGDSITEQYPKSYVISWKTKDGEMYIGEYPLGEYMSAGKWE